jgi:hypothetical protein
LINASRNTSAHPDRADVHVAVMDQPRLVMGIWIAARVRAGIPYDSADRAGLKANTVGFGLSPRNSAITRQKGIRYASDT